MQSVDILAKKSGEFCSMRIVIDLCGKMEKTYYIPLFCSEDYLQHAANILAEYDIIESVYVPLSVQFKARGIIFRHGIADVSKSDAILWGQPNK